AYLQLLAGLTRYLTPEWVERLSPMMDLDRILPAKFAALTDEELKAVNKEQLHAAMIFARIIVASYSHKEIQRKGTAVVPAPSVAPASPPFSSSTTPSSPSSPFLARDWSLSLSLTLSLRLMHSHILERSINGIGDMSELVKLVRKQEQEADKED